MFVAGVDFVVGAVFVGGDGGSGAVVDNYNDGTDNSNIQNNYDGNNSNDNNDINYNYYNYCTYIRARNLDKIHKFDAKKLI